MKNRFNLLLTMRQNYFMSLDFIYPEIVINKHSKFEEGKRTLLDFPTQILLTDGKEHVTIIITVLGFGLGFYLRSK